LGNRLYRAAYEILLWRPCDTCSRGLQTPAQAIDCFLRTQMDLLSIGGFLLRKEENVHLSENRAAFAELQTG